MTPVPPVVVVDASVAVKWVIGEPDSEPATWLMRSSLHAPDLIVAEYANTLWKKIGRGELTPDEAELAGRLLEAADLQLVPSRHLLARAVRPAAELQHPAYDCVYLLVAMDLSVSMVTADRRLRDLSRARAGGMGATVLGLDELARLDRPGRGVLAGTQPSTRSSCSVCSLLSDCSTCERT